MLATCHTRSAPCSEVRIARNRYNIEYARHNLNDRISLGNMVAMLHHHKTQVQLFALLRMALAFALIKQMLKFENSSKDACDFGS